VPRRFINDVQGKFKLPLKDDGDKTVAYLLWGDHAEVLETDGDRTRVTARDREGWIPTSALAPAEDPGLLEIYIIDVGQGDGILMRTPDDLWHVIDAGVANDKQLTKKGAANFIRWKFQDDLRRPGVEIANAILSHPDSDHYGGFIDLFTGTVHRPDRTFPVTIQNFYHNGMGRFAADPRLGAMVAGTVGPLPFDDYNITIQDDFITELLGGKASFATPPHAFEDEFAKFANLVATVPAHVQRLSHRDEFLPGFAPGQTSATIRILGPVLEEVNGSVFGLRDLGADSITSNGHSVVLRVDYNKARILLTGDLNKVSQRLLLSYHNLLEFAVDVAKACHHGSDEIDLRFVRAMKARTTVVSSGDNEDYAHPRPRVLGASARYGRESKAADGELLPPLLYSTELARSVGLAYAESVRRTGVAASTIAAADAEIKADRSKAKFRPLDDTPVSTDLIYGLINVRTDGTRVLCGYMEEAGKNFDIKIFRAGVEP
jgi:beta-lactamase superfamily II metal-dependent hydrolase